MIRRTSWRYYHRDHFAVAAQVAAWMGSVCEWSQERMVQEIERYRRMTAMPAAKWEPPVFTT